MRKILALTIALFLCLGLTACTPAAEVTPSPTPTLEVTPSPTPTPTPELSPAPTPHEWSDQGYSYTSKSLGIKITFPPSWMEYFEIVEKERTYVDFIDQDGNQAEPWTGTDLVLYPKGFTIEAEGTIIPLASIGFIPKGLKPDGDPFGGLTLLETEDGAYVCGMFGQIRLWYEPGISAEGAKYAVINEVQGGIVDGRWEIEVLDPQP